MMTPETKKRQLPKWYIDRQREAGKRGGKASWDALPEEKKRERIQRLNTRRLEEMKKTKSLAPDGQ